MEEWKPLIYHGEWFGDTYEVSSQGKIRNVLTGKMRKLSENKQGYLQCVISRGRKRKIAIKIHRAVAEILYLVTQKNLLSIIRTEIKRIIMQKT